VSFLKDYEPVEERLRQFWGDHPNGRVMTDRDEAPDGQFVFVATVFRDADDRAAAATGWAHETVTSLPANMKASALEVCETSAIGRALANLGYAPRGKRPSREEMAAKSAGASKGAPSHAGETAGAPAPASTSAPAMPDRQPASTVPRGTGKDGAYVGQEVGPVGEGGTDLKPTPDVDIVELWTQAVDLKGSTPKVVRYVKENIDKTIRSEADILGWHLVELISGGAK
jgi:hypothetical protein